MCKEITARSHVAGHVDDSESHQAKQSSNNFDANSTTSKGDSFTQANKLNLEALDLERNAAAENGHLASNNGRGPRSNLTRINKDHSSALVDDYDEKSKLD